MSKEEREVYEKKKETTGGQFVNPLDDPNKTLSQVKAKVLQNIDTFFYIGTEVSRRNCFRLIFIQKIFLSNNSSFMSLSLNEVDPVDDSLLNVEVKVHRVMTNL